MFNRSDEVHLGIIHGSVLAVTTLALSPGQPQDKVSASGPGVGYFSSGLAAGVGEGGASRNSYSRKDLWGDVVRVEHFTQQISRT